MTDNLTPKQSRFIDEYMLDLNATQAAIRAGYSEKTAAVIGQENLIKPYIQDEIKKRQSALAERHQITLDDITDEIIDIGNKAKAKQDYAVALNAQDKLAKLHGLYVDKKHITQDINEIRINIIDPKEDQVCY